MTMHGECVNKHKQLRTETLKLLPTKLTASTCQSFLKTKASRSTDYRHKSNDWKLPLTFWKTGVHPTAINRYLSNSLHWLSASNLNIRHLQISSSQARRSFSKQVRLKGTWSKTPSGTRRLPSPTSSQNWRTSEDNPKWSKNKQTGPSRIANKELAWVKWMGALCTPQLPGTATALPLSSKAEKPQTETSSPLWKPQLTDS